MSSTSDKQETATCFHTYGSTEAPVRLRSGAALPEVTLAYETYGTLNEAADNAILLFHALSGNQHAKGYNPAVPGAEPLWTEECHTGWWEEFIGPGKALDTDRYSIICVNFLGGCYGSTGPRSLNPETGRPYGGDFPPLHFSDIVDSQMNLLDHLGIQTLHAAVGPSLGGLMAMNLAVRYPDRVRYVFPIATGLETSTLQQIHNYEQIVAIETDPNFVNGHYYEGSHPHKGLALARTIAHKTYVSLQTLKDRARNEVSESPMPHRRYTFTHPVESYMEHQGMKFVERFDANTYLNILEAWQRFDPIAEGEAQDAVSMFKRCTDQRFFVFSIDSDVCYYPEEQRRLARVLKKAGVPCRHITIHSEKGHDAFLLDHELFTPHLAYTLAGDWHEA